ncbi:SCO6880 family protein, partial [Bacillus cereus]
MATRTEAGLLYHGWTKPRNTGLFGATWAATIIGFVLVISVMVTMMFAGFGTGVVVATIATVVAAPLVWSRDGRSGYEMTVLRMQWIRARRRKENIYRGGLFSELPGGKAFLPGIMAPTKLYEGEDAAGFRFGMIHMPAKHCYTVVLRAWPQGDEAVDQSLINNWVGEWGVVLAAMGQTSDIVAVVPVIDTVPETGNRLLAEVDRNTAPNAPALAQHSMYDLAESLPTEQVQLEARIAVTFRATTDARKKDPSEQAVEISRRLPG